MRTRHTVVFTVSFELNEDETVGEVADRVAEDIDQLRARDGVTHVEWQDVTDLPSWSPG